MFKRADGQCPYYLKQADQDRVIEQRRVELGVKRNRVKFHIKY